MTMVLFIGGPDDGKRIKINRLQVRHGSILSMFLDRPMSQETAARAINGDGQAILAHAALDRFDYRCVEFRCDDLIEFVAIDNALSDAEALSALIRNYRP